MKTYSMSQVETLTGINPHTLRIWERRYSFLLPQRTSTNIRFYTDEQVKNLLNIQILLRNKYRISSIDKMKVDDIYNKVQEILSNNSEETQDKINALVISMLDMDESAFTKIYNFLVSTIGFKKTITDIIYPFLVLIGGLWLSNKVIPAQEHFISNLIRQKILSAIEDLPNPSQDAKRILLFLLEGEDHEIGLLLAHYIAKESGWKTFYLGQNVPANDIEEIYEIVKPDLMMTMFITHQPRKMVPIINNFMKNKDVPLLLSGSSVNFSDEISIDKVVYIKTPIDLEEHFQNTLN